MLSLDLQKQIQLYLDQEISLSELEEWMVPRMRRFLADPNSKDADVVAIIEQGLAEMSVDLIEEHSLRSLLQNVITEMNISFNLEQSVESGTASKTYRESLVYSLNDFTVRSFPLEPSGT